MQEDRDTRPVSMIPFAQDLEGSERENAQDRIRAMFRTAANTAEDIVKLGCTGLVLAVSTSELRFAREHMAGAGFGIPCYVPPTRFCLVHNTIGGLQRNQAGLHPEGIPRCSRALTPEELTHAAAVNALINQEGANAAKDRFKAERVDEVDCVDDGPALETVQPSVGGRIAYALGAQFTCPEHDTLVWQCRFCVAAAVIHGPLQPDLFVEVGFDDPKQPTRSCSIEELPATLNTTKGDCVTVFTRVKQWTRRLVPTE